MATKFDVYNDKGIVVVSDQESPVTVTGLTPATKYTGWSIAVSGKTAKAAIPEFTTMGPFTISKSYVSRAYISPSVVSSVETTKESAIINITL